MHVAQFVHRFPPALGGAEAYTARLCEYLAGRGDGVRVWTTTAVSLLDFWQANGLKEIRDQRLVPGLIIQRYRPVRFPARRYILKALSLISIRAWQCLTAPCNPICPAMWRDAGRYDGPLDAVHATAFPYSFPILCALRLARRHGVPFYLTPFLHLGDPDDLRDRTRRQYTAPHLSWLLRQADGVFVQTGAECDAVSELGVPKDRVYLQGMGLDAAECMGGNRDAGRGVWSIGDGEVVVGHLANNSIEKGTIDLLRAAERAWANGKQFRVVLAGPEMPNFRAFWSSYPHRDRVIRLGTLNEEQKRDFFAAIDIFVLPSRTDSFGLVLLEAWANGKPNLVYRAGGPAEIVQDEYDGLQARCGDVQDLANQLRRLVDNPRLRGSLGERGRERIAREFRWEDKLELVRRVLTNTYCNFKMTKSTSPLGRSTCNTAPLSRLDCSTALRKASADSAGVRST
jgi:glycosyltransferase involved in cell wall biosynthesis